MKSIDRFKYTEEAIAFQDGKLFDDVNKIFKEVKEKGYSKGILEKLKLNEAVFKNTGIAVNCQFVPDSLFFHVYPPQITQNHVVFNNEETSTWHYEVGMKLTHESKSPIKGTVNTKTCKVTGVFSEMVSVVQMDPIFMVDTSKGGYGLSSEEYTAIFLHELGHVFTYFEYLTETVTTNLHLSSMTKRLLEINNYEERIIFLSAIEEDLQAVISDKEALAKTDNKSSIYGVLVSARRDAVRSSTDTWVYDYKSWEFLSDQFSIRHGAGKYLASGLYKIVGKVKTTRIDVFFSEVLMLLISGGLMATVVLSGIGVAIVLMYIIGSFMLPLYPHDDNVQRLTRMKNDMTEELKNSKLTNEQRARAVEAIESVNKLLTTMEDTRGSLETVFDYIRPAKRNARKQYEFQIKMEKLAANSMFLNSSKLKMLS